MEKLLQSPHSRSARPALLRSSTTVQQYLLVSVPLSRSHREMRAILNDGDTHARKHPDRRTSCATTSREGS